MTSVLSKHEADIEEAFKADPKEVAPYRFLAGGERAVEEAVYQRLMLFRHP